MPPYSLGFIMKSLRISCQLFLYHTKLNMKSSFFKEAIRLQFNALMMLTIKGTLKQKRKQLSKRSRHEILFCEMNEIEMNPPTTIDEHFFDMTIFQVLNFTVYVSDEKIGTALCKLSARQREFILLYYFQDMNDKEIAKLYHLSRSAISYTRNKGLEKLKNLLNEESYK